MNYKLNPNMIHLGGESYIQTFLRGRGLQDEDQMQKFLNPTEDCLCDPLLLDNIDQGTTMLKQHLDSNSIIYDVVDCDQDGVASSAILYNYLKKVKPSVDIRWSMHSGKQHGVELKDVPQEAKLIIIPDAGSNQYEEHKILSEQGYDILVIDHHLCDRESEYACVINNQMGNYPNKDLSGAGVVYKFIKYFDKKYGYNYADEFLDLAAVGIIGDVMNLTHPETRYIIKNGLSNLKNFGLIRFAMKQAFSISDIDNITPTDVSFYITPLVNAIIRVGTMEEKETLFKAFICGPHEKEPSTKRGAKSGDMEIVADKATRIATNAKNHQNKMKDESVAMIQMKIEKEELNENKILLIPLDVSEAKLVNPNLTGLIAMKLCQEYCKPTILVRLADDGVYKGSLRVNSGSPLENFKDFCTESGLVEYAEGHESAAGIGISKRNIDKFISYSNKKLKEMNLGETSYAVDFMFDEGNIDNLEQVCYDLAPLSSVYGKGVEEPKVIATNILITSKDVSTMGKDKSSVKINKNGISFIKFKDKDFISALEKYSFMLLTVYGRMNLNEFAGNVTPQVFIDDYELRNAKTAF